MANIREIQSRINSVKDTMKITNAMYMISSSKLTQARKKLADTEPYFYDNKSFILCGKSINFTITLSFFTSPL